jgi:uncharacterized RDD family membrane protein YckC
MISGGPPPPPPPGLSGGGQYPPAPYPPPPQYPTSAYHPGPTHAGPAPGIAYAGFWIRFIAVVIDGIIVGVPLFILFLVIEGPAFKSYTDCISSAGATGSYASCGSIYSYGSIQYFNLVTLVVQLAYFAVMWSSFGGTLGQRMLGLHVVDAATGGKIGIGRAIGRYIGYLISAFVLLIGLIWAAFDPRKQGWHDKMAGTFVVRKV